jgi:hypothetical protein
MALTRMLGIGLFCGMVTADLFTSLCLLGWFAAL